MLHWNYRYFIDFNFGYNGSNDALAVRISSELRTCSVRALRFSLQVIIWKTCSMETSQKGISVGGVISRPCLSLIGAIGFLFERGCKVGDYFRDRQRFGLLF